MRKGGECDVFKIHLTCLVECSNVLDCKLVLLKSDLSDGAKSRKTPCSGAWSSKLSGAFYCVEKIREERR